ncbi:S1 RNA-binding domain-containing protein [Desulfofundulus salinus]|uniref:S1 RNA-binding domain-containing protein n=1 Tax=Desulfofundulus salinus TaxID=2419843 RepID=A0A494WTY1_9FIRM|nr:S1 RNA-binding domain-containing protein [Desulfofundulus salinum]RKO66411.1 S1 RNA-binding domain-containing protein [Desulfofundulus salinum]
MRFAPEGTNYRDIDPWDALYTARDKEQTLNVTIVNVRSINGQGYTWEVSFGEQEDLFGIVGLIPESESGLPEGTSMNWFKHQVVAAKIKGIDRKNSIVALTRKEVVEENLRRMIEQLEESEQLLALVRASSPSGIVVDIGGGVLVRIPRREIKLSRAVPVEVQYPPGQFVKVQVTGIDKAAKKIDVSMIDPWQPGEYVRGEMVTGKIIQIKDNIAFVQTKPGLVGIAPYPKSEQVKIGETVKYQVQRYDPDNRVLHLVRWDEERIRGRRRQRARKRRERASEQRY